MKKRMLSLLLAVVLCLSLLPTAALADGTDSGAAGTAAIQLGTGALQSPTATETEAGTDYKPNSYVYFGTNGETPIQWRVLDADKTSDGEPGVFLLSEQLLGKNAPFNADASSNAWAGSSAQKWCTDFANAAFSEAEGGAIQMTDKAETDEEAVAFGTRFSASGLDSEAVFFLSAKEAERYLGSYDRAPQLIARDTDGSAAAWWLRSPYPGDQPGDVQVGIVNADGVVTADAVTNTLAARPALNLNADKVLFISSAECSSNVGLEPVGSYSGNAWKLTLKDDAHKDFTAKTTAAENNGLTFSYQNAKTGKNEYLSALVTNDKGEVTHYGRVQSDAIVDSGSTQFITLPEGFNKDTDTIYVFNEQDNGDYKTNYASGLVELSLTPEGGEAFSVESITAVGSGSGNWLNGANWDPADASNHMTETSSGSKIYEITYADIKVGDYGVKFAANDGWTDTWGADEGAGLTGDAVYGNTDNIYFSVAEDNSTVKLVLDLSKFDYETKEGATYSITITPPGGGTEEPSAAEVTSGGETTGYPTLEAAFAAVQNGDTVRLLEDVTEQSAIELSAAGAAFDLNGHTATSCTLTLQSGADLTITDSSAEKTGSFGDATVNARGSLILDGAAVGKITAADYFASITLKAGTKFAGYENPKGMVLAEWIEDGCCVVLSDGSGAVSLVNNDVKSQDGPFTVTKAPATITAATRSGSIRYNGLMPEDFIPEITAEGESVSSVDMQWYYWAATTDDDLAPMTKGGTIDLKDPSDPKSKSVIVKSDDITLRGFDFSDEDTMRGVFCVLTAKDSSGKELWNTVLHGYTFTLAKANLSEAVVTATNEPVFTPDENGVGQTQTLEFKVTHISSWNELYEGFDYQIKDNSNQGENAGEYWLVLEGMDNYTGTLRYKWEVKPCELLSFNPIKKYDGTTDLLDDIYFLYSVPGKGTAGVLLSKKDSKDFTATGGFDDPNAGERAVNVTITLNNENYTFEDGEKNKQFTFEGVSIQPADSPEDPQPVTITVYNNRKAVYTYDVSQLLPKLDGGRSYGTTTYSAWWNLDNTYVPEEPGNKPTIGSSGVLRLPINAVDSSTENPNVAFFKITVQSTNYYDFDLRIYVEARNPLTPTTVAPTLSKDTLNYGDKLSNITLSGAMTGENNETVEGTFAWVNPDETPNAGEAVSVTWKFTPTEPKYAEVTGTATITVNPAQLTGVQVDQQDDLTYNGSEQRASVETSATAVNDQPVTFAYCDTQDGTYSETVPAFTNAGEHTVYYKASAPNHKDAAGTFTVTIKPKTIADPVIELAAGSFVYNGSAHEPAVTVRDGDAIIDPNSYTVTYDNNINAGENTATVTIKNMDDGNYIISGSTEFTINKAAAPSLTSYTISQKYTVTTQQTFSLAGALALIKMPTDAGTLTYTKGTADTGLSSVTVSWAVDAASGNVTYTLTGGLANHQVTLPVTISSTNYADTTAYIVIKLIDRDTPTVSASRIDAIYTGGSISAQVILGTATFNGETVPGTWKWGEQQSDYTDVSDSGEKTVVFVPDDQVNFNPALTTLQLVIAPARLKDVSVQQSESLTYNGTAQRASVETKATAVNEQPVTFAYCDTQDGTYSETVPAFTDAGEYTVYYKASAPNHEDAAGSFKVIINKEDPICTAPTGVSAVYGQTLSEITLTNPDSNTPGTWTWADGTQSVGNVGEEHSFMAKFSPDDQINYNSRENIAVSVTVGKAQSAASAAPAAKGLVYTGEAQALIEPGTTADGTMMYSLSKDGDYVQTIPTGIGAGTYVVWYKIIGDDNHKDSEPAGVEVTIERQPVAIPEADTSSFTYNGADHTYTLAENAHYTIAGNVKKDAGVYTVTVTLNDTENFVWSDNTDAAKEYTFTIAAAQLTVTVKDKRAYVYGTAPDLSKPVPDQDYTVSGLIGSDTLTTAPTLTYDPVNPDLNKIGEAATIRASGASAGGNYEITYVDGKLTVITRPSSGGSSSGATKTETTTNPDGSTTKTETKSDGTVIETTTGKDGSTTKTETKPDGSSKTEVKDASGSTGTVNTDKNGSTTAEAKVSSKAVSDAKKSDEAVKIPAEVTPGKDSASAPTVKIDLPKNSGETKIEIPGKDTTPGTVAIIVKPDGTEEIVKESVPTEDGIQLTVSGDVTVKIVDNAKNFADTKGHWAHDSIDFVSARGLVNGTSESTFNPNAPTTRAQLWTILARQAGADLTGGSIWYEKAQAWVKANGISDGTNPNDTITRAQMVTMLWRTAGSPDVTDAAAFTDVPADSYYAKAVAWAVEHGITTGVGSGRFDPNGTCTRAQIATFLHRSYLSK